jgi:hypothetical protein
MGNTSSRTGEDQYNAVTGRAIGITGGGALKRVAAPKLPAGAIKSSAEDYSFIEVCTGTAPGKDLRPCSKVALCHLATQPGRVPANHTRNTAAYDSSRYSGSQDTAMWKLLQSCSPGTVL